MSVMMRIGRGRGRLSRGSRGGGNPNLLPVQALPFTDTFTRADGSLGSPWRDMNSIHPTQQDRVGIRSNAACDVFHQDDNVDGATVSSGWRGGAFVDLGVSNNISVTCNMAAGAAAGLVSGGPMLHYNPADEDLGIGCWYTPAFRLLELGAIVRTPQNFRYLDGNIGPDLTATAHEMKLRSVGGQVALYLDGDLFAGPVTIPAGLASSTLHGFATDDGASSVAETPTILDITAATDATALDTYTFPSLASAAKIGTPTKYTSGTTLSVPYPATVTAGDLLVCHIANGSSRTWSTPAGWTAMYSGGFLLIGAAFYKVADGTETGNLSVTASGAVTSAAAVIISITGPSAYYPTQQSTTATAADGCNIGLGTTTTVAPTRDLIGLNRMVLLFSFSTDNTAATHPVAFTEIANTGAGGAGNRLTLSARVASTDGVSIPQGATGTATVTTAASTNTYVSQVIINPKTHA